MVEVSIKAIVGEELVVCALFDEQAISQDDDFVGTADCREAMRDGDDGCGPS